MTREDVDAIWASVVRYYRMGLHPSIALCIRHRGEIIIDRAIGHTCGNSPGDGPETPRVKATPDTLFSFFSGSKAITAMLIHLLHERELLHVDEPVAAFIPEFARRRKARITIKDVLTHRAGIPAAPAESLDLDLLDDWDRVIDLVCDLEPVMKPAAVPAYHAITGGFVLGEIVRRVTGVDIQTFLRREVREPLGFKNLAYGIEPERLHLVAQEAFTGPIPTWPHKNLIEKSLGLSMQELVACANDPRFRTSVVPSGNIIATPDEVCRFFELLLRGGTLDGKRVFHESTVARAVEPIVRGQIDRTIMLPVPYSMGFMLGSNLVGFYGPRAAQAFGHLGFTNVLGWADPERDLSCSFLNTGKPLLTPKFLFWLDIVRII
ncbi:MAG: beta-lactamase family protein, partial [Polyangiaceae bacterium]|nr:beta-lactamase family protein [Polyangiaceae bacterium]